MKTIIVTTCAVLFGLSACGGSTDSSIHEELDKSWESMSSEDQATFCVGYFVNSSESFLAGAVDRFGDEEAQEAVAWAKEKCD